MFLLLIKFIDETPKFSLFTKLSTISTSKWKNTINVTNELHKCKICNIYVIVLKHNCNIYIKKSKIILLFANNKIDF